MTFLVDSDVLSEPTKAIPHLRVVEWLSKNEHEMVVTPIVIGELEYGILLLDNGRRRKRLENWFTEAVKRIQVIDFDTKAAAEWARLLVRLKRNGAAMPIKDSLIAASALAANLIVATRNTTHYVNSGVKLVNPFSVD